VAIKSYRFLVLGGWVGTGSGSMHHCLTAAARPRDQERAQQHNLSRERERERVMDGRKERKERGWDAHPITWRPPS
jgi:hypothetical protein